MTPRLLWLRHGAVAVGAVALGLAACGVEPATNDECHAVLERTPGCPTAAVVVMTDFLSSQVALTRLDGATLCGSLISTARAPSSGVAYALSGDLVVPSSRPESGRVVLLDRYGTNVITWLSAESGAVTAQLPVGTGFQSNPQDYAEIGGGRALVSRWGENPFPGSEPFDAGGDLLLIDTETPVVLDRVELPRRDGVPPRPSGLTRVGDRVIVTLQRASRDAQQMAEAELVGVDVSSPAVVWTLALGGVKNCGPLTPSPSGATAALACTGYIDSNGVASDVRDSALLLFDLGTDPPSERARYSAAELVGDPLQSELEFFGETRLLVKTQTPYGGDTNNRLLAFDLAGGGVQALAEARPNAKGNGQGVVFGGLLCAPGCGDVCLAADADSGVLRRFRVAEGAIEPMSSIPVRGAVGLPPRDLGAF
jgi:hypothetical protein